MRNPGGKDTGRGLWHRLQQTYEELWKKHKTWNRFPHLSQRGFASAVLLRQHFMQREKTWIWSWSEWKTSAVGDSDRHKHFTVYVECRVWWPLKDRDWLQVCLYASKADSFYMKLLEQDMLLFCRDTTHYPTHSPPSLVFLRKSKGGRSPAGLKLWKLLIHKYLALMQQCSRVSSSKYSACLNTKTNYTAEFVHFYSGILEVL